MSTNIAVKTTCVHFHIEDDFLAKNLKLKGGSDAVNARWLDIDDSQPDFANLYASHRDMVIQALKADPKKFGAALEYIKTQ